MASAATHRRVSLPRRIQTSTELELRIDPEWEPVPDVAGSLKSIHGRYPTEPLDVVIEVLSPDDRMFYVMAKCQNYARIGIAQIFVLDSESRLAWQWLNGSLQAVSSLILENGNTIHLGEVWQRMDNEV